MQPEGGLEGARGGEFDKGATFRRGRLVARGSFRSEEADSRYFSCISSRIGSDQEDSISNGRAICELTARLEVLLDLVDRHLERQVACGCDGISMRTLRDTRTG